jgi:hypothetical protein
MQEQFKEITEEAPEFSINSKPGVDDRVRRRTHRREASINADNETDFRRVIGNHFSTSEGKRIKRILENVYYHRMSYDKDNARQTDFNEGQRDVVAFIINCVAFAALKNKEEAMTNG